MNKIDPEDLKVVLIAKRKFVNDLEDILIPYKGVPDDELPVSATYLRKELKTHEQILDALFAEYMGETAAPGSLRRRIVLAALAEMHNSK